MTRSACTVTVAALTALLASGCHQNSASAPPLPGSSSPAYAITDIGVGVPAGLNNNGQIVGEFPAGVFPNTKGFPYFHGFLWDNGKRTEMTTFGGWYSDAKMITDNGQILGTASVREHTAGNLPVNHQCLWQNNRLTDLEATPRFRGTQALHITKSGSVYAASPPLGPKKEVHLWFYPNGFGPGIRQDKGVIGGPEVTPTAINDSGMVAGNWDTGKRYASGKMSVKQAFVWHIGQGKWTDLGTLGGRSSEVRALNNAGQIIGSIILPQSSAEPALRVHAFLWSKGQMNDLGTLPGGDYSVPTAINDKGQIVGHSNANQQQHQNNLDFHPVIWEQGQIKDLSQLIPAGTRWNFLGGAASINDHGQIVGDGGIKGDHWAHGYFLTPIGYKAAKGDTKWRQ